MGRGCDLLHMGINDTEVMRKQTGLGDFDTCYFYLPPSKLRDGEVSSPVCLQGEERSQCDHFQNVFSQSQVTWDPPLSSSCRQSLYLSPAPITQTPGKKWSTSFNSPYTIVLRNVKKTSICGVNYQQAGGWHSTEIPSCFGVLGWEEMIAVFYYSDHEILLLYLVCLSVWLSIN